MSIKNRYQVERKYISLGKSRSGKKLVTGNPTFIVSHEVGGSGGADAHYNYFNGHPRSASAHTFIDNKKILEIIPLTEKAWHVQYQKQLDNRLFGEDANDAAIGVEMCRTSFKETYDRYVWYHAYLCKKFNIPADKIVAHSTLDPARRRDPESWLIPNGVSWKRFIKDVSDYVIRWNEDKKEEPFMLEKAIVINTFADYPAAEPLATKLEAPIFPRSIAERQQVAKEIFVAGGLKEGLKGDKFTVLSGANRYETAQNIGKYLNQI